MSDGLRPGVLFDVDGTVVDTIAATLTILYAAARP